MQIDWKQKNHKADGVIYQQCIAVSQQHLETEELDVALAEIIHSIKDKYIPIIPPYRPPVLTQYKQDQKDISFKKMPASDRNQKVGMLFARDDVKKYLADCEHALGKNLANVTFLEEQIAIWLKWGEDEKAADMYKIYNTFPDTLSTGSGHAIWTKKKEKFNECKKMR